jgi:4-amino-4-deoxy-L-arabinose transferase-like glycosyltransferase
VLNLTKKVLLFPAIILFLSILVLFYFDKYISTPFLTFSDGAKYADIARNIFSGLGYGTNFYFFPSGDFNIFSRDLFPAPQIAPLMPVSIAISFVLFGISDFSVVATSSFYFILLVIATYLLGQKVFSKLVGFLGAITVLFDVSFLSYATTGASEPIFALEIVFGAYLFILKKRWADLLGFITLVLMYFTRPQAFIYIAGLIFLWLLLRFPVKKALLYFAVICLAGILIDIFILSVLSGKLFLYSILGTSRYVLEYVPGSSSSELLRGVSQQAPLVSIFKKVFYNLYNFYKLTPQIISPYMWALFVIGLFKWGKNKIENSFKVSTIFIVLLTFLITALTIPLYRYLHPIVPFVYLFAVATLAWFVEKIVKGRKLLPLTSSLLIFLFIVGQTLGVIFLDSRFSSKNVVREKPPVYVQLARILKDNTKPSDVVVTNLDSWGSWYGERKTIWYPLRPEQLKRLEDKVDAIYLTSYLTNDENYYMGPEWRQIFENPNDQTKWICDGCSEIKQKFQVKGVYQIAPEETYDRLAATAVLLVKK